MSFKSEHIWIIGASSGIGRAVAQLLARDGATLILSARRKDELTALNKELGGQHHVVAMDVADTTSIHTALKDITGSITKIDRVLFLAAVYEPTAIRKIDMAFAKKTMEVNLLGAMAVTQAILPVFDTQKNGQLVLCASVAAYTGLPNGQPYSASKAALLSFAESLYAEEQGNIDIKVINPGFVRTPMTDKNSFDMPMRIEPEQAAAEIIKGLTQRGFEIHFPKRFTYIMKFIALMPNWIRLRITSKL